MSTSPSLGPSPRARTLIRPPDHPASGVQAGKVRDPFGHIWLVTRVIGADA